MKVDIELKIKNNDLQNRLNIIIQEVRHFWEQAPYTHFTNHGPSHSERIHRQKLAQLNQELPEEQRLTEDEIFIVSAAAWLYEIGMQCTNLTPFLNFRYQPTAPPTFTQLQQIREHKHLLTERMIIDSTRSDYHGPPLRLGLVHPDDYTRRITEVCRWISNEPLENVPEKLPVSGLEVRVRLLVALLRLADQLYIDSSRVNLELLQAASLHLPPEQLTRWWAYHYMQTLPILKGQIRFHYFLPSVHKPLLGHIRTLIEPDFEYNKNPTIRYLWEEHGLRLIPQKHPNVSFEQQAGFQHEMSRDLVIYLRENVTPIPDDKFNKSILEDEEKKAEESNLLVLDYENFLLQLGQQGYFPTLDEMGSLFLTLLTEAKNQYPGAIDGLAAGHWQRPDLVPIARLLEASLYSLLTAEEHEKSSKAVNRDLTQRIASADPPKQTLLVAPDQEMAPIIKRFSERRQAVSAWISDLPEARIYRVAAQNVKSLPQVLGLTGLQEIDVKELELSQAACILRLEESMVTARDGLSLDKVSSVLEHVEQTQGRVDWWRLWLMNKEILQLGLSNKQYLLKLNADHPSVITVCEKRDAVIRTLQNLAQGEEGLQQDTLQYELSRLTNFRDSRDDKEEIVKFLELLKDVYLLHLVPQSSSPDSQPIWHLNPSHWAVVALNADHYLPLLVLGIDHLLVREGYQFIHEHTLKFRLASYIESSVFETVYQLALNNAWVERRVTSTKHPKRDEYLVEVKLADEHEGVRTALLNRDILLDVLYRKSNARGLEREALSATLSLNRRCTLQRDDLDAWLSIFNDDSLIGVQTHAQNTRRDCISLRMDSQLVQRLLGRLYLYGIIQTLRINGATYPDKGMQSNEVVERLAQHITRGNKQLAAWTLAYAKTIWLVEPVRGNLPGGAVGAVYLKKQNSFVLKLDEQERIICSTLANRVREKGQHGYRDGWVPQYLISQDMEQDSKFGYTNEKYDYWFSQTIFRYKLLERKKETPQDRRPQFYVRALPQERH